MRHEASLWIFCYRAIGAPTVSQGKRQSNGKGDSWLMELGVELPLENFETTPAPARWRQIGATRSHFKPVLRQDRSRWD